MSPIRRIVLAYSGGLDTSIIVPFLRERYANAAVIGICVDVGQREDWDHMRSRGKAAGLSKLYIVDAREQFVRDFLFPMVQSGALYEQQYLLGTAIARPLQAAQQVRIALQEQADAVAHGCTGKGNDQLRFELTYRALAPQLQIIAPWRMWDIRSRQDAIAYAHAHNIPLGDISERNIYSRDWNIWHMSHEGGDLEDLANRPQEALFRLSTPPHDAPDSETEIAIEFADGIPVALNDTPTEPVPLLAALNRIGGDNGVGRVDIVESRIVGMKSRGIYETPGGTILYHALRELENITLDHDTLSTKRILAQRYADLIYGGHWHSHLRECIDGFMVHTARWLNGIIRLALYRGNIIVVSRTATQALYNPELASFSAGSYDHTLAEGFIRLYGLATEIGARTQQRQRAGTPVSDTCHTFD